MSRNLNEAAMAGNLDEVIMRLNMGEDPNESGHLYPRVSTPLHDATTCGRQQVVKVLIERYNNNSMHRIYNSLCWLLQTEH